MRYPVSLPGWGADEKGQPWFKIPLQVLTRGQREEVYCSTVNLQCSNKRDQWICWVLGEYPLNLAQTEDTRKSLLETHTMLHVAQQKSLPMHIQFLKSLFLWPTPFCPLLRGVDVSSQSKQEGLLVKISLLQPALPQGGEEHSPGGGSQGTAGDAHTLHNVSLNLQWPTLSNQTNYCPEDIIAHQCPWRKEKKNHNNNNK